MKLTALENKGPVGWKESTGRLGYKSISALFGNRVYNGKISDNKITWTTNNSIWTRVLSNSGPDALVMLTGKWVINQSNGYKGTLTLQQDSAGRLTGSAGWNGNYFGSLLGKTSGNDVEFTISYPGNVKGHYKGTVTLDGNRIINGTVKGSTGESAKWDASRQGGEAKVKQDSSFPSKKGGKLKEIDLSRRKTK